MPLNDDADDDAAYTAADDYYDDIDIDEDVEVYGEKPADPTSTPRRIRQRVSRRPLSRREPQGIGKGDPSTPGKYMTPRQRLRRASISAEAMKAPIPLLNDTEEDSRPPTLTAPATPGSRRVRRASLGHVQQSPQKAILPVLTEDSGMAHNPTPSTSTTHPGKRGGRSLRRASIQTSNPLLQRTLAQMPQDPTHAIRGDLKEEWKKQEQLKDMQKKASQMQKRYQGSVLMGTPTGNNPTFEANFSDHSDSQAGESGADLEIPKDQLDVSDISSNDGLA